MIHITLSPHEMLMAGITGLSRQITNIRDKRVVAHNQPEDYSWQSHVEGALGEYTVSKYLDKNWHGNLGKFRLADVGDTEVRTGSQPHYRLILHPEDKDEAIFILVTGLNGTYDIRGWIYAWEGKKEEYWEDPKGGRPAYFPPQSILRPIEELKELVKTENLDSFHETD